MPNEDLREAVGDAEGERNGARAPAGQDCNGPPLAGRGLRAPAGGAPRTGHGPPPDLPAAACCTDCSRISSSIRSIMAAAPSADRQPALSMGRLSAARQNQA